MAAYLKTDLTLILGGGHFVNYKYVDNTAKLLTAKQLSFS
jgi:hypothetical protein